MESKKDKYLNLENAGSLVSFSLLLAVIFSLVRFHFYFQVLLHVPVFQFIDASELVLITAAYGIKWLFYYGTILLALFIISNESEFTKYQKVVFPLMILSFGGWYIILNYHNDPIIRLAVIWPTLVNWWQMTIILIVFIAFIIAYVIPVNEANLFFKENKFIISILITVWFALLESFGSFYILTQSKHNNELTVQTKLFGSIKTNDTIVDAGRTKNYWFFYNRNTHVTRVVKTDDIEYTDFNAKSK